MQQSIVASTFRDRLLAAVIDEDSLIPAFQPIIDLKDNKISSFEVLARWNDSELGIVPPGIFIPLIEQAGLLDEMSACLIRTACTHAAAWEGNFRLTFNISPKQFARPDLATKIARYTNESAFSTDRVQIEITEDAIFDDSPQIKTNVDELKRHGMRIILDDFGTGHSNLVRLHSVAFDKIKIDASFVRCMEWRKDSRKIISAVIGLGQSLGLSVVAEGIENEQQLKMLKKLGCDYGQGYYFSKPVFAEQVPELLLKYGQAASESIPVEMSCNRRIAELDALYENERMSISFIDNNLRFISMGRKFCEAVGVDAAWATGREIVEVFPHNADMLKAVAEAASDQSKPHSIEVFINTSAGIVLAEFIGVKDESGDAVGFSMIIPNEGFFANSLQDRFSWYFSHKNQAVA